MIKILAAEIAEPVRKNRSPSICESDDRVEVMSYAGDDANKYRCAACSVDRSLKDAKPADLPVEQPMKFEFIINLKTAKQIGVTIPQWTLMKADRVIN